MSVLCLILNVCSRDCDTTFSLFWSFIDVLEIYCAFPATLLQNLCDSSCQSCFTMVNVSDGTNVTMGLVLSNLALAILNVLLNLRPLALYLCGSYDVNVIYQPAIILYCNMILQAFLIIIHFLLQVTFPERSSEPAHISRRTWSSYHGPVFWNAGLWSNRTSQTAEQCLNHLTPPMSSIPSIRPRRELISPITSPMYSSAW